MNDFFQEVDDLQNEFEWSESEMLRFALEFISTGTRDVVPGKDTQRAFIAYIEKVSGIKEENE